jgi:hypothetical protein
MSGHVAQAARACRIAELRSAARAQAIPKNIIHQDGRKPMPRETSLQNLHFIGVIRTAHHGPAGNVNKAHLPCPLAVTFKSIR